MTSPVTPAVVGVAVIRPHAIISSVVGVGPFRAATVQTALAKIVAAFGASSASPNPVLAR